jgi:hypothetical protein
MRRRGIEGLKYYVYALIDPRDGSTFYVGKGKGNRIDAHELEASKGKPGEKCDRIRNIISDGCCVEKTILRRFALEQDAYDYERDFIDQIGLENLTNIIPGGGSVRGKSLRARSSSEWTIDLVRKVLTLYPEITRQWIHEGRPNVTVSGATLYQKCVAACMTSFINTMMRGAYEFAEANNCLDEVLSGQEIRV